MEIGQSAEMGLVPVVDNDSGVVLLCHSDSGFCEAREAQVHAHSLCQSLGWLASSGAICIACRPEKDEGPLAKGASHRSPRWPGAESDELLDVQDRRLTQDGASRFQRHLHLLRRCALRSGPS
ncbi:unnamed protein product, partial [Polarella glacialis]